MAAPDINMAKIKGLGKAEDGMIACSGAWWVIVPE